MATTEAPERGHDRHFRRRPFSTWMKRLANLKTSSSETHSNADGSTKRNGGHHTLRMKKSSTAKNNPYPASGNLDVRNDNGGPGNVSFSASTSARTASMPAFEPSKCSSTASITGATPAPLTGRSVNTTASTEPGTTHSDAAHSTKAASSATGTNITAGGATSTNGGIGSTFSSPAPSVRSLTTTLTTVQSTGPASLLPGGMHGQTTNNSLGILSSHSPNPNNVINQSMVFSHQFPSSPPASAIPPHLTPLSNSGHPTTYSTATANNLLTDNASILTLASSSKRQRRHSLDTNASVRALAPSSLWGGSRESLPLSVLSGNIDPSMPGLQQQQHGRPSVGGLTSGERASVYSVSGVGPALSSERNSLYAGKQNVVTTDGASIKSGYLGHGRNDSVTGSIGGASLLLASPREVSFAAAAVAAVSGQGRISRRNSEWAEVSEEIDDGLDK
ncbi:MAG: hypothetical protein M1816_007970 [Peltula sp. TS41687]|nr:MAG: hypothetical protein M1816_007970 [Peltula sp. TS41687]